MFSSNAVLAGVAVGRRRSGRVVNLAGSCVSAILVMIVILSAPASLLGQNEAGWVGKRVVPRTREFVLLDDDQPVEPSRKAIAIYRVERADGPMLWLRAEGQRLSGSTRSDDVFQSSGPSLSSTNRSAIIPRIHSHTP